MIKKILTKKGFKVFKVDSTYNYLAIKDNIVIAINYQEDLRLNSWSLKNYKKKIDNLQKDTLPYNFIKEFWLNTKKGLYRLDIDNKDNIEFLGVY